MAFVLFLALNNFEIHISLNTFHFYLKYWVSNLLQNKDKLVKKTHLLTYYFFVMGLVNLIIEFIELNQIKFY